MANSAVFTDNKYYSESIKKFTITIAISTKIRYNRRDNRLVMPMAQRRLKKGDGKMEYLLSWLENLPIMRWSDFLDILIVAFLIYKLLPVLRSTGTVRVAVLIAGLFDRCFAFEHPEFYFGSAVGSWLACGGNSVPAGDPPYDRPYEQY